MESFGYAVISCSVNIATALAIWLPRPVPIVSIVGAEGVWVGRYVNQLMADRPLGFLLDVMNSSRLNFVGASNYSATSSVLLILLMSFEMTVFWATFMDLSPTYFK